MEKVKCAKGIGILQVVFVVLLVLKLTGLIDWSWYYVTMPLWLIPSIIIMAMIIIIIIGGVVKMFNHHLKQNKYNR